MVNKPLTRPAISGGGYVRGRRLVVFLLYGGWIYHFPDSTATVYHETIFSGMFGVGVPTTFQFRRKKQLENIQTVLKTASLAQIDVVFAQKFYS